MTELIQLLKVFLEKYLIKTLLSIVLTSIGILAIPAESIVIQKIGEYLPITLFSLMFLICCIVEYVINKIKSIIKNKDEQEIKIKRKLERIWGVLDKIPEKEFELVQYIINNNNEPVAVYDRNFEYEFYVKETLFRDSMLIYGECIDNSGNHKKFFMTEGNNSLLQCRVCKLQEATYELLKYSKEKYGKISNIR